MPDVKKIALADFAEKTRRVLGFQVFIANDKRTENQSVWQLIHG